MVSSSASVRTPAPIIIAGSSPMATAAGKGASGSGRLSIKVRTCRHSLTLKPNRRGPSRSIRLYDRLPRPETGSLLTITPPVMKAPPSPREWVGMGSAPTSISAPVRMLACHAACATRTGGMPLAGSITRPITPVTSASVQPNTSAARFWLATPLAKTGHSLPVTASNRGAPPPLRTSVAATSASSCTRLTGWRIRANCPASSSTAINDRKSLIFAMRLPTFV